MSYEIRNMTPVSDGVMRPAQPAEVSCWSLYYREDEDDGWFHPWVWVKDFFKPVEAAAYQKWLEINKGIPCSLR